METIRELKKELLGEEPEKKKRKKKVGRAVHIIFSFTVNRENGKKMEGLCRSSHFSHEISGPLVQLVKIK